MRKVGCLPIDAQVKQALPALPPEAYARMPLKSAAEVERFVSANFAGIKRAINALEPQARPDYRTAKKCFAAKKLQRGTTALMEWTLTSTTYQFELGDPRFYGTTDGADAETTQAARECVESFRNKAYRVVIPSDNVADRGFFQYQGSVILPVRFNE
jgi:hypothetical protein